MPESRGMLSELTSAGGVKAAAVIRTDGAVLDRIRIGPEDEDVFSRASRIALRLSESLGTYRDIREFVQMWIQFEGGLIVVHRVSAELLLFVVGDEKAQIGMLRHRIQKAQPELAKAYVEVPPVEEVEAA
ncbi:MAG: roadblock/LC7 domain-containing protein [Candidatus Latescibacteria bacterium]|nr:roadblock/LC7 domain-containing protein [Candidatus Latescibacterota bacterium]MCK5327121.1 roadblock/LC7 domain-containing protein [Candidatus Latescibacterota bacterium]MCK5381161.1 roadblock/LC7 domain-containing protein [Candidatus Latescibacterota bacterium]MCK5734507.1 roadblock/LC7 domain-containing protein [Candidatus Latescibacterota bacterium]